MSRSAHVEAILGAELYSKICDTRVLMVGAGGIGCELLKNIVMAGFGHITILDLDTIDLSNLNRQFLFRKKDVKQSKALVAARTVSQFNPAIKVTPIHADIKDPQYDVDWFSSFDIVLNALDNLDARRHVNKMCLAADVPLVESGTAGYLGQVQPILKDHTECFDCLPKATAKTFPVCTIRSTPSQPIHCIVWAKSYLMPKLFGDDDEDDGDLDAALAAGEDPKEIASLKSQAHAFRSIRQSLSSSAEDTDAIARQIFMKVYNDDIKTLLVMNDMWKHRTPPTPLDCHVIEQEASSTRVNRVNGINGVDEVGLRDQKALSLYDCVSLFIASIRRLTLRQRSGEPTISFDKDDIDTLDFVTAASDLRSFAYNIPVKTKWEVKEMAGNIIPAIATTNAIIAGLIVLQALHLLRRSKSANKVTSAVATPNTSPTKIIAANPNSPLRTLRNINIQSKSSVPLSASRPVPPNPKCAVCRDTYTQIRCNPTLTSLSELVDGVMGDGEENGGTGPRDVSVFEGNRLLADPDFDDNLAKPLSALGIGYGKFVTIVDEDKEWNNLSVAISRLPPNRTTESTNLVLSSPLPIPRRVTKPTLKRLRSSSKDVFEAPITPAKKQRLNGHTTMNSAKSPSKKQRLEAEGLVIVDRDDDIIVLDD